jgi:hypothetical protein
MFDGKYPRLRGLQRQIGAFFNNGFYPLTGETSPNCRHRLWTATCAMVLNYGDMQTIE